MTSTNIKPVALVTGGARRIGAALCQMLHQENFNVLIHYCNSKKPAEELANKLNQKRENSAKLIHGDLNNMSDIKSIAQEAINAYGRVDVLINNASTFFPTPLETTTEQHWDNLINSNLKAPFFLSQQLAEPLKTHKGCIINISDIFAQRPMPTHTVYSIAKAGNNMLTQSLALELAPKVRVNGIAPGAILWPEDECGEEVVNLAKLSNIPLGKLGGTEAITKTAIHLIKYADYVTGQVFQIDGGRSLLQ